MLKGDYDAVGFLHVYLVLEMNFELTEGVSHSKRKNCQKRYY